MRAMVSSERSGWEQVVRAEAKEGELLSEKEVNCLELVIYHLQ